MVAASLRAICRSPFFRRGNSEVTPPSRQSPHLHLVTGGPDGGGESEAKLPRLLFGVPAHCWKVRVGKESRECEGTAEPNTGRRLARPVSKVCVRSTPQVWAHRLPSVCLRPGQQPSRPLQREGCPTRPPGALLGQASAEAPLMPKRCSRTTLRAKQGAHGCPLLRGAAWREGLGAWMTVPWGRGM